MKITTILMAAAISAAALTPAAAKSLNVPQTSAGQATGKAQFGGYPSYGNKSWRRCVRRVRHNCPRLRPRPANCHRFALQQCGQVNR